MLDDETKKRLEQMTPAEQENRLQKACTNLGLTHPQSIVNDDAIAELSFEQLQDFEEYEYLKKLLGFD